jgi:hypothetical protein
MTVIEDKFKNTLLTEPRYIIEFKVGDIIYLSVRSIAKKSIIKSETYEVIGMKNSIVTLKDGAIHTQFTRTYLVKKL